MKLTIKDILEATGGVEITGQNEVAGGLEGLEVAREFTGLSIDSRIIKPGEVFLALKGDRFDGHEFITQATERGASGIIVDHGFAGEFVKEKAAFDRAGIKGLRIIGVSDTLTALGDVASHVRQRREVPLVAVGGTNGKTTTKEMTAAILGGGMTVLKSTGNMNNLVGLPLTLLGLNGVHDCVVVELGINVPGEMKRLYEICRPDVSVITNIGRGHLEGLGTTERVAEEKLHIYGSSESGGVRVVNLDDKLVGQVMEEAGLAGRVEVVTFSRVKQADVMIKGVAHDGSGGVVADFDVRGECFRVRLASPLLANVYNAAAAIAATLSFDDVTIEHIEAGLEGFSLPPGRMQLRRYGSLIVLDDSYNSNPESLVAALQALSTTGSGRKVCVVGDMLELGGVSQEAHIEAGFFAGKLGLAVIVSVGRWSEAFAEGALSSGMDKKNIFSFSSNDEAIEALKNILKKDDTVLVKGSRGAGMESVVGGLKEVAGILS